MAQFARKRFGQHFLHDPVVIGKLLAAIDPEPTQHFVEIGGGHGALTLPLLERVARLDVIEIDRDLAAELEGSTASLGHVAIHCADALRFEYGRLAGAGERLRVVGNLPYNISTPLLFKLLEHRDVIDDLHVMLQKEVVARMTASPGSKDYGRLTIMLAPWADIESCFDIGPGAFAPPPQVRSSLARLKLRSSPRFEIGDERRFARLVAKLFSMRRKTLRRALRNELDAAAISAVGIDPGARPENLRPEQFATLAALIEAPP